MVNQCIHLSDCAGCHFGNQPYAEQIQFKLNNLELSLNASGVKHPKIKTISLGENKLRHRFDFTIENQKMGLYNFEKKIIDLQMCQQISDQLLNAFIDFKKIDFNIRKGSVRIRISPQNQRGVWLDFANMDIKKLLDAKQALSKLLESGFHIEIGQKGKSLIQKEGLFKLGEPVTSSWFQTKLKNNKLVLLECLISSFTQPSWLTAEALVDVVITWTQQILKIKPSVPELKIAEFGSGIGQFTLPLLSYQHFVDVYELDENATQFLKRNAVTNNLNEKLNIFCGDFQKSPTVERLGYDLVFVNPPRSGLKKFVYEIIRLNTDFCIYISCYPESLILDLQILCNIGYEVKEIILVDQFPQTKHFETCVLLQRINPNI
ncbi:MAG: methyltransferase [Pseudobdellovibrio sp.]